MLSMPKSIAVHLVSCIIAPVASSLNKQRSSAKTTFASVVWNKFGLSDESTHRCNVHNGTSFPLSHLWCNVLYRECITLERLVSQKEKDGRTRTVKYLNIRSKDFVPVIICCLFH